MNTALLVILICVCLFMMLHGLARRGGVYQLPFLMGSVFLGFIVPQVPGLIADPYLPQEALSAALVTGILCALGTQAGWSVNGHGFRFLHREVDDRRIEIMAAAMTAIGGFFYYKLGALPDDMLANRQWSGAPVAMMFFAKLLNFGFVLAVVSALRTGRSPSYAIAFVGAMFYLEQIFVAARRGDAAEFFLVILLSVWFMRRKVLPRALMVAGVVVGTVLLWSTHDYRGASLDPDGMSVAEFEQIDFAGNIGSVLETGGEEMRNATFQIMVAETEGLYSFSAGTWNWIVFVYVPAQILGKEFKESLMLETPDYYAVAGYRATTGSTETGIADAFTSFWYFGWIKFFIIGFVMRGLYRSAMAGSAPAQVVFMLSLPPALHAVTHHTQILPAAWVHMLMLLLPAFLLASRRRPAVRSRAEDGA